jgi:mono/diheme cytochrome c family protein
VRRWFFFARAFEEFESMDLVATLIAVVLVVLAVGAVLLGATLGAPGAVKAPAKPRLEVAAASTVPAEPVRPSAVVHETNGAAAVAPGTWSVRRPRPAPAISGGVLAGAGTVALIVVALGAYFIWLPAQQSFAADRQLQNNVHEGAALYTQDCAGCHGPSGAGQSGPDLHIYAGGQSIDSNGIAARNKVDPNSPQDMTRLLNLVQSAIGQGRPDLPSHAWSQDYGGPLRADQVSALADLIITSSWDQVVPARPAGATPAGGPAAADAMKLMQQYDCGSCHTISSIQGAVGTVGPNLSVEGSVPRIPASSGNLENTPENMQRWIYDAPAIKPGVVMPNFSAQGMSLANALTIANYLETLTPSFPTPVPAAAAGAPAAPAAAAPAGAPAPTAAQAPALITKYGCGACHTISSIPGAVGTVGPDLSKEGSETKVPRSTGNLDNTPQNLQTWIFNAPAVKPGIAMPNFSSLGMTQDEAKAIAEYLESHK